MGANRATTEWAMETGIRVHGIKVTSGEGGKCTKSVHIMQEAELEAGTKVKVVVELGANRAK